VHAAPILAGHDLDLGDHRADEVHRLAALLAQELRQIRRTAPMELCGFPLDPITMLSLSDEGHSRQIWRLGKRFHPSLFGVGRGEGTPRWTTAGVLIHRRAVGKSMGCEGDHTYLPQEGLFLPRCSGASGPGNTSRT
jgi:hypothetical protein